MLKIQIMQRKPRNKQVKRLKETELYMLKCDAELVQRFRIYYQYEQRILGCLFATNILLVFVILLPIHDYEYSISISAPFGETFVAN